VYLAYQILMNCVSRTIRKTNPNPVSAGDLIGRPVLIADDWQFFKVPTNALLID
jgi:hypothetical protein